MPCVVVIDTTRKVVQKVAFLIQIERFMHKRMRGLCFVAFGHAMLKVNSIFELIKDNSIFFNFRIHKNFEIQ